MGNSRQEQEATMLLDEVAPDRMTQPMVDYYNANVPVDEQVDIECRWVDQGMWLEQVFLQPIHGVWQAFRARYANWDDIGWGLVVMDNEGSECLAVQLVEIKLPTLH